MDINYFQVKQQAWFKVQSIWYLSYAFGKVWKQHKKNLISLETKTMSNQALKQQVLDCLETFEDDIILDEIYRLLQVSPTGNDRYVFTDSQMNLLNSREEEIEKGHFLTEEEADQEAEKWLEK